MVVDTLSLAGAVRYVQVPMLVALRRYLKYTQSGGVDFDRAEAGSAPAWWKARWWLSSSGR